MPNVGLPDDDMDDFEKISHGEMPTEIPATSWKSNFSQITMQKLASIKIDLDEVKTLLEPNENSVKFTYTDKDFEEMARKLNKKIEEMENPGSEDLKKAIRTVKNNMSSEKYREKKKIDLHASKEVDSSNINNAEVLNPDLFHDARPKNQLEDPNLSPDDLKIHERLSQMLETEYLDNIYAKLDLRPSLIAKFMDSLKWNEEYIQNWAKNLTQEHVDEIKKNPKALNAIARKFRTNVQANKAHRKKDKEVKNKKKDLEELIQNNKKLREDFAQLEMEINEMKERMKVMSLTE